MIKGASRSFAGLVGSLGEWSFEGGEVLACCPAHGDSHPSLILSVTDAGRLLVHCRAGCSWEDVGAALGVESFHGWVSDLEGAGSGSGSSVRRGPLPSAGMVRSLRAGLKRFGRSAVSDALVRERFGLGSDSIDQLGLAFSPAGSDAGAMFGRAWSAVDRLVVPLVGFDGALVGAQGRAIGDAGDAPRWAHLRNVDPEFGWGRFGVFSEDWSDAPVVLLCEGPSDGLTLFAAGFDAVAITGAALSSSSPLADVLREGLSGRRVVAIGDGDEAGERFNAAVREIFPSALVVRPPAGGDVNEWFLRDGSGFARALRSELSGLQAEAFGRHARFDSSYWGSWSPKAHSTVSDRDIAKEFLRWVDHRGQYVAFLEGAGLVAFVDGRYDVEEGDREVRRLLFEFAREAQGAQESGRFSGHEKHLAQFRRIGNARACSNVMAALESIVDVIAPADLDWDPNLLAVANGVVDLRTGALLKPDRGMRLSSALATAYDPEAECPLWERFVLEIMDGDEELAEYLQRLLGYGITGHTSEQVLAFLYGRGANGKSMLQGVLQELLGPVSVQVNYSALAGALGGGPQPEVMSLRGSRLTFVPEASATMELEDSTVKLLTGGDPITARALYKAATSFVPRHLILVTTNSLPVFTSGSSHGIMRRLRLVPFKRTFAKEEQRPSHEMHAELMGEAEGILRWLVDGARKWAESGLREPEAARVATELLQDFSDVLGGFLPGPAAKLVDGAVCSATDLYLAFEQFRKEFTTIGKMPLKAFVIELRSRGLDVSVGEDGVQKVTGVELSSPLFGGD